MFLKPYAIASLPAKGAYSKTFYALKIRCIESLTKCLWCSYGNADVRYSICSIILQRVVGMTHVSREDQRHAHAYALQKLDDEKRQIQKKRIH